MSKEVREEVSDFDRFWEAYPSRKGDRAKTPAKILFEKALKEGVVAETIIRAARAFATAESDKVGTVYIMQAQRWLRNKRWLDFVSETSRPTTSGGSKMVFVHEGTPQWKAWQSYSLATTGKRSPMRNFGWWFPQELPPEITHQEPSNG